MRNAFARRVNMVLLCGEHQKPFHTRLFLLAQYNNNNNNRCDGGGGGQYNNIIRCDYTYVSIHLSIYYYYDDVLVSAPLTASVTPLRHILYIRIIYIYEYVAQLQIYIIITILL
jgi:hypothetical protein